jgi:DNA-binding transcriptional regulator PaaX
MEEEVGRQTRNTKIQKAVLQTIAAAGILSVALLAPNAFQMFKSFDKSWKKKRRSVLAARERLLEHGLIEYKGSFLKLTRDGERKLAEIERLEYKLPPPKRWDKKWRILIFDIPESKKNLRNKIRATLISIGFKRIQDSVWAYPYDCEDLVLLLKADFQVGKELLYLIVEKIEHEQPLKEFFALK